MIRPRSFLTVLALCGFLAAEVASPLPQFHRHSNELADLWSRSAGVEIGSPAPAGGSSSGECPACAIFGLSAITSSGPSAPLLVAPVARVSRASISSGASRTASVSRGRAPPSA